MLLKDCLLSLATNLKVPAPEMPAFVMSIFNVVARLLKFDAKATEMIKAGHSNSTMT
jgi:hypothetical protein